MKGVTDELATEIKTEIREVIAKVDNVLSESAENLLDSNSLPHDKRYRSGFYKTNSIPSLADHNYSPRCSLTNFNENASYFSRQKDAHETGEQISR